MLQIFNISGSAVSAEAQRLNTVASNLANVDTVPGSSALQGAPGHLPDGPRGRA